MAISVYKPSPPSPEERAKALRTSALALMSADSAPDDATILWLMTRFQSFDRDVIYSVDECRKAIAEARVLFERQRVKEDRRRRNERAGQLGACFFLLVLIGMVVWAILSR